jgi:hypothetical protein
LKLPEGGTDGKVFFYGILCLRGFLSQKQGKRFALPDNGFLRINPEKRLL